MRLLQEEPTAGRQPPNFGAAITLCVDILRRDTEQTGKQPIGITWPEMIRRGRQVSKDWNRHLKEAMQSTALHFDAATTGQASGPRLEDVITLCIDVLRPSKGCTWHEQSAFFEEFYDTTWYEVLQRLCLTNTLNARRRVGIARLHGLVAMRVDRRFTQRLYYGDLMEPPSMAPYKVATRVYRTVHELIMTDHLKRELSQALVQRCDPDSSWRAPWQEEAGCTTDVCRCPIETCLRWRPVHGEPSSAE